jgi:hypothetical protein
MHAGLALREALPADLPLIEALLQRPPVGRVPHAPRRPGCAPAAPVSAEALAPSGKRRMPSGA